MTIKFDKEYLNECLRVFMDLDPMKSLYSTHYDLAAMTPIKSTAAWKEFLTDTRVDDWISSELEVIRQVEYRRVIQNASKNEKSVGAAQMMNALSKASDTTQAKEGNIFVYCYTPLNAREKDAPNTHIIEEVVE